MTSFFSAVKTHDLFNLINFELLVCMEDLQLKDICNFTMFKPEKSSWLRRNVCAWQVLKGDFQEQNPM